MLSPFVNDTEESVTLAVEIGTLKFIVSCPLSRSKLAAVSTGDVCDGGGDGVEEGATTDVTRGAVEEDTEVDIGAGAVMAMRMVLVSGRVGADEATGSGEVDRTEEEDGKTARVEVRRGMVRTVDERVTVDMGVKTTVLDACATVEELVAAGSITTAA